MGGRLSTRGLVDHRVTSWGYPRRWPDDRRHLRIGPILILYIPVNMRTPILQKLHMLQAWRDVDLLRYDGQQA